MRLFPIAAFAAFCLSATTLQAARLESAYLFDTTTHTQTAKLTVSREQVARQFGKSVAISGTTAIVGARRDDRDNGSAYLFDTTTGTQLFKLTSSDADYINYNADYFGQSVGISGTTAIVGANGVDDNGDRSGSAYLFDTTTGTQLFKLTASDAAAVDYFGRSVAISGTTAIVGAFGDDDDGDWSGSVYLFDTTTGTQLFKLTASDAAAGDYFGRSVAVSGTTAIVGATHDANGNSFSNGSAYLFDTTTGTQIAKLTSSGSGGGFPLGDGFGYSVAISGTTAIVGAYGTDGHGSAYLFDALTGTQLFKLTASDADHNDRFGQSVSISGTTAVIGAQGDDGGTGIWSGSAYLFDTRAGAQFAKLTPGDPMTSVFFGQSVGISGTTAIIGASTNFNVPLPAGIWLLGSAIGLIVLRRRS